MLKAGQTYETLIDRWDGGMKNDSRYPAENTARIVSNFDIYSSPRKMSPYRASEDGQTSTTHQTQNYAIARFDSTPTYRLFGLGRQSALNRVEILMKDLTTSSNDLADGAWITPASNYQGGQNTPNYDLFVYYQKTGRIYGAHTGTHIWAFDPTLVVAFNDTERAIAYTNLAQGIVFSKDDILYIPYDNKIAKNDNGDWTDVAITLPAHLYITSICEYGDYIAIACAPLSGVGNSKVFLWNRNTSLETLTESLDWGEGIIKVLGLVDGYLVGISISGTSNNSRHFDRITFKAYNNAPGSTLPSQFIQFAEFLNEAGGLSAALPIAKQYINNRLYFMLRIRLNGTDRQGVWSVGRNESGALIIVHERTTENDVALGNGTLRNFFVVGDYMFISYQNDATTFKVSKTDNSASSFAQTAIYESKRFNGGDSSFKKKLLGITVMTEPLPSSAQVVLLYKVDAETAFKVIATHDTDNALSKSVVSFEGRTATMTIASPGVVTLTSHGLIAGDQIYFTTTGALPTGVTANTTYFVISTGLTASAFQFSATSGGSAVNTSGSQSGTHTLYRVNGALPQDYKEIEFRLEATGGASSLGAEIIGLSFKEAVLSKDRPY